jgi:hypothetical protein
LKDSVAQVGGQFDRLEERVRSWDQRNFDGRLQQIEASVDAKLGFAQKQASESAQVVMSRLRGELESRLGNMDSRVAEIETKAEQDSARVVALQTELARVRGELQQQQSRIEMAEGNSRQDKEYLDSRINDVQSDSERGLGEFVRSLETRRVDFEISKGHSQQIVEGVSIGVEKTSPAYRRVSGWLWIMPDRKTVWLRDQNAMEPVAFYSEADGKRREVVFTHVTSTAAVGYLLLPPAQGDEQAASGGSGDPAWLARRNLR